MNARVQRHEIQARVRRHVKQSASLIRHPNLVSQDIPRPHSHPGGAGCEAYVLLALAQRRLRPFSSRPQRDVAGLEALVGGCPVEALAGRNQAVFEGHLLNTASIESRTRSEAARSCVSLALVFRARSRSRGEIGVDDLAIVLLKAVEGSESSRTLKSYLALSKRVTKVSRHP